MRVTKDVWVPLRLHNSAPPKRLLRALYEVAWTVTVTFAVVALLQSVLFRVAWVSGSSMLPTLHDGQMVVALAVPLDLRYGDIVIVSDEGHGILPHKVIVKRVVGLPGDEININFLTGVVYRNGVALAEPYVASGTNANMGMVFPLRVPRGTCFLLGDNRNQSEDSRSPRVGFVDQRYILGRVLFQQGALL